MSATLERLRALRRQAGTGAPMPPPPRETSRPGTEAPPPHSTRPEVPEHIRRLLGLRERARLPRPAPPPRPLDRDRRLPGLEVEEGLHYLEQFTPWDDVPPGVDAGFGKLGELRTSQLLHFDTETTGLAGGTGTRAFMIGAADWQPGGLRLRQLTIATMAAEPAMLRRFADWLAPDTVLVSYNGKCYDAPLLNTRYRLARLPSPLPGLAHLDLLHPSRRRWKGRWENCRLGTIERQVLGVVREDDLPGSEAPRAWLDYLRGGSARDLRRVGEHNAQDLRSLAALCLHLAILDTAPP
ncbi:ribonuclease H-like domain-containing protein [Arenimonas sp.]|uniref:ribonuclease H-like domain-containing protein n=1 Tax=Arenimonas sp. TaxID=1872635 RepID=UPI0039C8B51A